MNVIKALNKKHQHILLNKIFDAINVMVITNNLFNVDDDNVHIIHLLKLVKKIMRKIMIEDEFIVKMDKTTIGLIDKFNKVQGKIKKRYSHELILDDDDDDDELSVKNDGEDESE